MTRTATYKTTASRISSLLGGGSNTVVINPGLAYIDLVAIKVEGTAYDIIRSGTPTNNQVKYQRTLGVLTFDSGLGKGKSVFVIYQR
jgi:hypothetical protein